MSGVRLSARRLLSTRSTLSVPCAQLSLASYSTLRFYLATNRKTQKKQNVTRTREERNLATFQKKSAWMRSRRARLMQRENEQVSFNGRRKRVIRGRILPSVSMFVECTCGCLFLLFLGQLF